MNDNYNDDKRDNAWVIRGLVERVNADRADLLAEFVDRDVCVHPGTPGAGPDTNGMEELRESFRQFHEVFPDLHIKLDDVISSHDRVAARWTATGTHTAELAGVPGTGRFVRWGGIDIYRLTDKKVVEWWRNDDTVELLHQLGCDLLPSPGP